MLNSNSVSAELCWHGTAIPLGLACAHAIADQDDGGHAWKSLGDMGAVVQHSQLFTQQSKDSDDSQLAVSEDTSNRPLPLTSWHGPKLS